MMVQGPKPRAWADFHVLLLPDGEDRAPDRAGVFGPAGDGQDDDHLPQSLSEDDHEAQGDHDQGQGELDIHGPHDEGLPEAPLITGGQPQGQADHQGNSHADKPDQEGDPQADR